jgi:hypothetical protein
LNCASDTNFLCQPALFWRLKPWKMTFVKPGPCPFTSDQDAKMNQPVVAMTFVSPCPSMMENDRRRQWSFTPNAQASWLWAVRFPDSREESSVTAFRTLKDCADDARAHGYVVWRGADRRRSKPTSPSSNRL